MKYANKVVRGKGRGEKMGTPTVNIRIPKDFPYPHGIYAGYLHVGSHAHRAAFHYGPVPTFSESAPTLEAFILRGHVKTARTVSFELIHYMRPIKTFLSTDALVRQIKLDARRADDLFS